MQVQKPVRICLTPHLSGVGGMVSFQHKIAQGLTARGFAVVHDLNDEPYQAVLVIGGTRNIAGLLRARRKGIPVIQRLDGMNWLHRLGRKDLRLGWRHYLRAQYGNVLLSFIRRRLANGLVYQSEFVRGWWERVYGPVQAKNRVIYNGVDLDAYSPHGAQQRPQDRWRVLMVEGSLMGGYEQGLDVALELVQRLAAIQGQQPPKPLELMVVGRVSQDVKQHAEQRLANAPHPEYLSLNWGGLVERQQIPEIDRSAHILYSADINAACPNSVIEALACGLPVAAFDTGAIPELVTGQAGCVVPYGGDPWLLDPPDVTALAGAALDVLQRQDVFRTHARQRAESALGLEQMVDHYLEFLVGG